MPPFTRAKWGHALSLAMPLASKLLLKGCSVLTLALWFNAIKSMLGQVISGIRNPIRHIDQWFQDFTILRIFRQNFFKTLDVCVGQPASQ